MYDRRFKYWILLQPHNKMQCSLKDPSTTFIFVSCKFLQLSHQVAAKIHLDLGSAVLIDGQVFVKLPTTTEF